MVVGIEQRLDGLLAEELLRDGHGDAVARHVGQLLIHQLRRIGAAFADEIAVEPFLGDALELAEQIELRFFAGIAPFGVEQALGEVEDERGWPHVAGMLQIQVHAFADDAGVPRNRRADEIGGELQDGVIVEVGAQPFLGQLDAIALDTREADFQRIALGRDRLDLDRLARRLRRRRNTGLAVKSKGMPRTSAYSTLNSPSSLRS